MAEQWSQGNEEARCSLGRKQNHSEHDLQRQRHPQHLQNDWAAGLEVTAVVQAALHGRDKRIQKHYNPSSKYPLFQHSQFLLKLVKRGVEYLWRNTSFMARSPNGSLSQVSKLAETFCTSCAAYFSVWHLSLSIPPTLPCRSAPRPKHSNKDIFPLLSSLIFQMPLQIPVSPNANNVNMPAFFFFSFFLRSIIYRKAFSQQPQFNLFSPISP